VDKADPFAFFAECPPRTASVVTELGFDWGDHDCVYFLDPDGNLLELVGYRQAHAHR
jgi:1,4-alpha-glucan branching enzyme